MQKGLVFSTLKYSLFSLTTPGIQPPFPRKANLPLPRSRAESEDWDDCDPLRRHRASFCLPDGLIYLDGNSLGPPSLETLERIKNASETQWAKGLISSWNDAGWISLAEQCGAKLAPLLGVEPSEVIVSDSVSINIFKLGGALLKLHRGPFQICEEEFPTDSYVLEGLSKLANHEVRTVSNIDEAFDVSNSIILKSVVDYKTAEITNIARCEEEAQKQGSVIIWDLSHATGLLDLSLKEAGAHFAVGCGYKYLNGGPGAPGYVYSSSEKVKSLDQPLSGWMGHKTPFEFSSKYAPADGVRRFACGTPPILSLSALDSALDSFADVDMAEVERKALRLGDLFISLVTEQTVKLNSPMIGSRRGGHVSLVFEGAYPVVRALIERGVIGDFRAPNIMRFGFSPLFVRYVDVWDAACELRDVLASNQWCEARFQERQTVT